MIKGFRDFISRGNVIDLAVAEVIGTAFTAVVTSLVKDILTPVVAAIFGEPDFSDLAFTINGSRFSSLGIRRSPGSRNAPSASPRSRWRQSAAPIARLPSQPSLSPALETLG